MVGTRDLARASDIDQVMADRHRVANTVDCTCSRDDNCSDRWSTVDLDEVHCSLVKLEVACSSICQAKAAERMYRVDRAD